MASKRLHQIRDRFDATHLIATADATHLIAITDRSLNEAVVFMDPWTYAAIEGGGTIL